MSVKVHLGKQGYWSTRDCLVGIRLCTTVGVTEEMKIQKGRLKHSRSRQLVLLKFQSRWKVGTIRILWDAMWGPWNDQWQVSHVCIHHPQWSATQSLGLGTGSYWHQGHGRKNQMTWRRVRTDGTTGRTIFSCYHWGLRRLWRNAAAEPLHSRWNHRQVPHWLPLT